MRGVTYASLTIAAKALGVTRQAVANAERRGTLDTVGLGHVAAHKKAVLIKGEKYPDGKHFPSIIAAARDLGAPPMELYKARSDARAEGKRITVTKWGYMAWLK